MSEMRYYEKKYGVPPIHVCTQCGKEFVEIRCPYCGTEAPPPSFPYAGPLMKSPTALWYLLPFLFGIIGGIVAYVGVKDEDTEMANSLLIFSLVWTIVLFLIYIIIF